MVKIILLILCLIGCIRSPYEDKGNCKDISAFIKMEACVPKEVYIGDSLGINISYINISDSSLTFYPRGYISIWKPGDSIYFDIPNGEAINKIMDYRDPVVIKAGEKFLSLYSVKVSRALFHEGIIDLEVDYRIAYEKEIRNNLCGRIRSNIIQIRVRGELDY